MLFSGFDMGMSLSLFFPLHQPPSLPLALVRAASKAEHCTQKLESHGWMGGDRSHGCQWVCLRAGAGRGSKQHVPASWTEPVQGQSCLSSLQPHLRRGPHSAQCWEGFLPSGPGRDECISWLLCLALLCSLQEKRGSALPVPWHWAEARASPAMGARNKEAMAVGQD